MQTETDALKRAKLSDELESLAELFSAGDLELQQLVEKLGPRGHAFVCLVCGLPFVVLPLPGVSIPFGILIMVAGLCMATHKPLWVPKRWQHLKLKAELSKKLFLKSARLLRKVEYLLKPRGKNLFNKSAFLLFAGLSLTFSGLLLALPLPPGTNVPPALAVALLSLGVLEEDVLAWSFGFLAMLLTTALFSWGFLFGFDILTRLWGSLIR